MRSIVESNPGEGPQRSVRPEPLTRIASIDALRPLPTGEVFGVLGWHRLNQNSFRFGTNLRRPDRVHEVGDAALQAGAFGGERLRGRLHLGPGAARFRRAAPNV